MPLLPLQGRLSRPTEEREEERQVAGMQVCRCAGGKCADLPLATCKLASNRYEVLSPTKRPGLRWLMAFGVLRAFFCGSEAGMRGRSAVNWRQVLASDGK